MFTFLFLLYVPFLATANGCEPGIADTCFDAVTKDLRYMLNLRTEQAVNITTYAVTELCLAIDDALNCTSDIINEDCTEQDGRLVFDSWLLAFRSVYRFACDGPRHKVISDILHATSCWSVVDFVMCFLESAGLTDITHILHSDADLVDCEDLHADMVECRRRAKVGSCREQDYVFQEVDGLIKAFFDASLCENVRDRTTLLSGTDRSTLSPVLGKLLTLIHLSFSLMINAIYLK